MKLCSDCKHCRPASYYQGLPLEWLDATCDLTAVVHPTLGTKCVYRRADWFDKCGTKGKQWEAKK